MFIIRLFKPFFETRRAAVHRCSKMEQEAPAVFEAATRREEGFWVAVLPFKFSGINSEIAVLSEGLTEEIVTGLARFPYLRVIARSSTLRLVRALRAAERAFDIDPASLMANYALAETQYFCGDLGTFRAAAERTLALNSRCSYTMAHLGLLFCFSGEWERGLRLAERAIDLCPHHPGWYRYGNFFDKYRQGNYAEALAIHQKINMPDFWVAHCFAAMTQAQLGNRAAAQAEAERTLHLWPEFERIFGKPHLAKWFRNQPDLIAHILEGVILAGFRLCPENE